MFSIHRIADKKQTAEENTGDISDILSLEDLRDSLKSGKLFRRILAMCMFTYKPQEGGKVSPEDIEAGVFPQYGKDNYQMFNQKLVADIIGNVVDTHFWDILKATRANQEDSDTSTIIQGSEPVIMATTAMLVRRYVQEANNSNLNVQNLIDFANPEHYRHAKEDADKPQYRFKLENQTKDIDKLIDGNRGKLEFISKNADIPRLMAMKSFEELVEYVLDIGDDKALAGLVTILDSKTPMVYTDNAGRPKFTMSYYIPVIASLKDTFGKKNNVGSYLITAVGLYGKDKLLASENKSDDNMLGKWTGQLEKEYGKIIEETEDTQQQEQLKELMVSKFLSDRTVSFSVLKANKDVVLKEFDTQKFLFYMIMGQSVMGRMVRTSIGADRIPIYADESTGEEIQRDIADTTANDWLEELEREQPTSDTQQLAQGIINTVLAAMYRVMGPMLQKVKQDIGGANRDSKLRKDIQNAIAKPRQSSENPEESKLSSPADLTTIQDPSSALGDVFTSVLRAILEAINPTNIDALVKESFTTSVTSLSTGDAANSVSVFGKLLLTDILEKVSAVSGNINENTIGLLGNIIQTNVIVPVVGEIVKALPDDVRFLRSLAHVAGKANEDLIEAAINNANKNAKGEEKIRAALVDTIAQRLDRALEFVKLAPVANKSKLREELEKYVSNKFAPQGR